MESVEVMSACEHQGVVIASTAESQEELSTDQVE